MWTRFVIAGFLTLANLPHSIQLESWQAFAQSKQAPSKAKKRTPTKPLSKAQKKPVAVNSVSKVQRKPAAVKPGLKTQGKPALPTQRVQTPQSYDVEKMLRERKAKENIWQKYQRAGLAAAKRKDYATAQKHLEKSARLAKKFGTADERYLAVLTQLASIIEKRKGYAQSEKLLRAVLGFKQKAHGRGHLGSVATMVALGDFHSRRKRYDLSVAEYAAALRIQEANLGSRHVLLADILAKLGTANVRLKRYDAADEQLRRGLALVEHSLGKDHKKSVNLLQAYSYVLAARSKEMRARAAALRKPSKN